METDVRTTNVDQQARVFLAANILVIYVLTVVASALAIDHFQAPLFTGDLDKTPNILMLSIWFLYYAAPLILASIFGILFRPFWPSFRNLLVAILTIQFLFSFTVCMLRWDYLRKFNANNLWRKNDKIKVLDLDPKHYDLNEDGFLDQIKLSPVFDFTKIRPSEYVMDAALVPSGGSSPFTIDGGGAFVVSERGDKNKITKDFVIKPRTDHGTAVHLYQDASFQVKFLLFRVVTIDKKGKKLLGFTRWSPYLRSTTWQGSDPQIFADMILLNNKTTTEKFTLPAPSLDTNGN